METFKFHRPRCTWFVHAWLLFFFLPFFVSAQSVGGLEVQHDTIKATIAEGDHVVTSITLKNKSAEAVPYYFGQYHSFAEDYYYLYKTHLIPFGWEEISGIGTRLDLDDDDSEIIHAPFPLSFGFYPSETDELLISSNGYLVVSPDEAPGATGNDPMNWCKSPGNKSKLVNLIGPYWDDLAPDSLSGIYYWSDPSRIIVQYTDVPFKSTNIRNTFQVIILRDGKIRFQYLRMNDQQTASVVVGMSKYAGEPVTVSCNELYVKDSLAVQIEIPMLWMNLTPSSGVISPGDSAVVEVDLGFVWEMSEFWGYMTPGYHEPNILVQTSMVDSIREVQSIPVALTIVENPPPVFSAGNESVFITEGSILDVTITATDNDSIVVLEPYYLPDIVSAQHIENGLVTVRIAPPAGSQGTYYMSFKATDINGNYSSKGVYIYVQPQYIKDFSLVYAKSNVTVFTFQDTVELDVAHPDIDKLTIRANRGASFSSVRFSLDGAFINTDNGDPFLINAWVLPVLSSGYHVLRAEPFQGTNATGTPLSPRTVIIKMINSAMITGFEVVRNNGAKLMDLEDGSTIDLSKPGYHSINIIARTNLNTVRSVRFTLNGVTARIDNRSPFGVYGASSGSELPWPIRPGNYTLRAVPYMNYYGWGVQGTSLTVQFSVVNGAVPISRIASGYDVEDQISLSSRLVVYPVPVKDDLYLKLDESVTGKVRMTIQNMQGVVVYQHAGEAAAFQNYLLHASTAGLNTNGIYIIRLQYASGQYDVMRISKE